MVMVVLATAAGCSTSMCEDVGPGAFSFPATVHSNSPDDGTALVLTPVCGDRWERTCVDTGDAYAIGQPSDPSRVYCDAEVGEPVGVASCVDETSPHWVEIPCDGETYRGPGA